MCAKTIAVASGGLLMKHLSVEEMGGRRVERQRSLYAKIGPNRAAFSSTFEMDDLMVRPVPLHEEKFD